MKTRNVLSLSLLAAFSFIGISCSSPFFSGSRSAATTSTGDARLVLTVNGLAGLQAASGAASKTIMPDLGGKVKAYKASIHDKANGSNSASDKLIPLASTVTSIALPAGSYTISIQGLDAEVNGTAIVAGSGDVTLSSGSNAALSVSLSPVLNSGSGTVSIKLSFPQGYADSATASLAGATDTLTVTSDSSVSGNSMVTLSKTVAAGSYLLSIKLAKGGATALTYMDSVWIVPGATTSATKTLTSTDFSGVPTAPGSFAIAYQLSSQTSDGKPGMLISWSDLSNNETAFVVRRSTDNATFSQVGADLSAGTTSYRDSGLTDGVTYYYRVTAKNDFGESAAVSGSETAKASSSATGTLAEGIQALENKDFDTAYTKFNAAVEADPANTDACLYAALMNIASISVDSNTVSLLKDRIGLTSYPSTMNELLTNSWFNQKWYGTKDGFYPVSNPTSNRSYYVRGNLEGGSTGYYSTVYDSNLVRQDIQEKFVPSDSGSYYCMDYYDVSLSTYVMVTPTSLPGYTYYSRGSLLDTTKVSMLPAISVPTWVTYSSAYSTDGSQTSIQDYPMYLVLNLLDRNPNGLDSMIDSVLSGVFGDRLAKAIALIDSLPDTAEISIPNDLVAAYVGSAPSTTIYVDKAELLVVSAALQTMKSFIQNVASYELNYPLSLLQLNYWSNATSSDGSMPAYADTLLQKAPNPIKNGFMGDRSQATRSASKSTMLDALSRMDKAIGLLQSVTITGASHLIPGSSWTADSFAQVQSYLSQAKTAVAKLASAINSNSALYIDESGFSSIASTGISAVLPDNSSGADTWTVYPGILYTTDLFNPAKFLNVNTDGGVAIGAKVFGYTESTGIRTELTATTVADMKAAVNGASYSSYQMGISSSVVSQLLVPSSAAKTKYNWPTSQDGYYWVNFYLSSSPQVANDGAARSLLWIRGYNTSASAQ